MDYESLKELMLRIDDEAITSTATKEWWVSTEWLVGTFAGRFFTSQDKDDAIKQMCDYFDENNGHDSIVGNIVKQSGWPNLDKVEKYLLSPFDNFDDKKLNEGVFLSEDWLKDLLDAIDKEERKVYMSGNYSEDVVKGMRKALEIIKNHI